jgi:aerobic-type carbon monoxide dehydrogenase small subunit (CoxS/CutS family)
VVASTALLRKHPDPTLEQIKNGLAGNLCRCGTYSRIFEAVQRAARRRG